MRTSIKWLKDYVNFTQSAEELADMLTMAGIPVAYTEEPGKDIENVVSGKILEINVHPDADRLSVCKVDVVSEVLTIITGATNIKVGQIVPVALVGAKLPGGVKISASKLRGLMSYGMLCSAKELNLDVKIISPEARDGIYILPADSAVGIDIRKVLGLDDVILEFELTANRADCFSVIGLAREIAVLTGGSLKKTMLNLKEAGEGKTSALATVRITDPELCGRFSARILQDVKIGPSPSWMQQRIQAAGMRPINNVVDVTNFVMLEMGLPMHAYDYNLLSKHSITVRRANPGEPLTTLDNVKRELTSEMIVIADEVQAVGIAGVMGGLATEVTANTKNILLEAASFNGVSIRRTSRQLGLRSEASGRFERGVDTANVIKALDRAAKLLEDMGACKVCPGIIDAYPQVVLPHQVVFTAGEINDRIGSNIPQDVMIDILHHLEFAIDVQGEKIIATAPSWRADVTCSADISEEIARIYGFDKIAASTPVAKMTRGSQPYQQTVCDKINDILTSTGFSEIISFSFTHPDTMDKLNIPEDSILRKAIQVMNPITDDFPLLRTTVLGNIMETIARNLSRKNEDLKIFELGAVYLPHEVPLQELPTEEKMLCGAMLGKRYGLSWNLSRELVDFYDAKGAVEILLAGLGITDYQVSAGKHDSLHPGKTAVFSKNNDILGYVGEAHPEVLDNFGINRKVYLFELNVKYLQQYASMAANYQPLPKFPAINRDLALLLSEDVAADKLISAIKQSAGPLLTEINVFDVYSGEQVPAGCRSIAISLTFRATDKTLTDEEVENHYQNIVEHLDSSLAAKRRV